MTIPNVSWDETSPAGTDAVASGDNRIRELKAQIREIVAIDHEFGSSGQSATAGQHKQITLQEQANLGTGAVGATLLGSQTVGGKGELMYTDEDDNDIQITNAGKIGVATISLVGNACDLDGILTSDDITIDTNNTWIKSKNAAGSGTVNLIKANGSDVVTLPDTATLASSAAPTANAEIANKKYVDDSLANITIDGWVRFNGTGTIAIDDSYNVTSLTDIGSGDYDVNWDTDFANANYSTVASANAAAAVITSALVGAVNVETWDSGGTKSDVSIVNVIATGD